MSHSALIVIVATALFCCYVSAEFMICDPNEHAVPLCDETPACQDWCKPIAGTCKKTNCRTDRSTCRCIDGYARERRLGHCIRKEDCPAKECDYGQKVGACGELCEGTCKSPTIPANCPIQYCGPDLCQCDLSRGFVRKEEKGKEGKCVLKKDC